MEYVVQRLFFTATYSQADKKYETLTIKILVKNYNLPQDQLSILIIR